MNWSDVKFLLFVSPWSKLLSWFCDPSQDLPLRVGYSTSCCVWWLNTSHSETSSLFMATEKVLLKRRRTAFLSKEIEAYCNMCFNITKIGHETSSLTESYRMSLRHEADSAWVCGTQRLTWPVFIPAQKIAQPITSINRLGRDTDSSAYWEESNCAPD